MDLRVDDGGACLVGLADQPDASGRAGRVRGIGDRRESTYVPELASTLTMWFARPGLSVPKTIEFPEMIPSIPMHR